MKSSVWKVNSFTFLLFSLFFEFETGCFLNRLLNIWVTLEWSLLSQYFLYICCVRIIMIFITFWSVEEIWVCLFNTDAAESCVVTFWSDPNFLLLSVVLMRLTQKLNFSDMHRSCRRMGSILYQLRYLWNFYSLTKPFFINVCLNYVNKFILTSVVMFLIYDINYILLQWWDTF